MTWWRKTSSGQQTKGFEEAIDAKFDMLEGGQYTVDMPAQQSLRDRDPKTPLTLLEARNALAIATAAGAANTRPIACRRPKLIWPAPKTISSANRARLPSARRRVGPPRWPKTLVS